jgi:hypothetical protein
MNITESHIRQVLRAAAPTLFEIVERGERVPDPIDVVDELTRRGVSPDELSVLLMVAAIHACDIRRIHERDVAARLN